MLPCCCHGRGSCGCHLVLCGYEYRGGSETASTILYYINIHSSRITHHRCVAMPSHYSITQARQEKVVPVEKVHSGGWAVTPTRALIYDHAVDLRTCIPFNCGVKEKCNDIQAYTECMCKYPAFQLLLGAHA
jgi:hypothetical protein